MHALPAPMCRSEVHKIGRELVANTQGAFIISSMLSIRIVMPCSDLISVPRPPRRCERPSRLQPGGFILLHAMIDALLQGSCVRSRSNSCGVLVRPLMVILSPCLNPMPPTPLTHTSLVVSPCFRLTGMAASGVSAGNQHMLITVSGFRRNPSQT